MKTDYIAMGRSNQAAMLGLHFDESRPRGFHAQLLGVSHVDAADEWLNQPLIGPTSELRWSQ